MLRSDYEAIRPDLVKRADRWLQTFHHYASVVEEDGVGFLFAIQPMVNRGEGNKKLSAFERQFDDLTLPSATETPRRGTLVMRFFFDDYLADQLRSITEKKGGLFCDLGQEIRSVDATVELYTDYCHLTPEGNEIVGRLLAKKILSDLPSRMARRGGAPR